VAVHRGRTYRIQIDVFAEEYVTVFEDGSLVLEDAVTGAYVYVERDKLDVYARSGPPYTAHVVECIQHDLLTNRHDACEWPFVQQPEGGWWYREGRCPTCGNW
jgi:hypothetical protein